MKKSYLKGMVTSVSVAAALMACPAPASAATDMFLKLGNIKGESVDAQHKGEIDVLAWSWGESDNTAAAVRGRRSAAPDCIQDLSLTKFIDRATPDIIMDAVLGRIINEGVLTLRRSGGDAKEQTQSYLTLTLSDVTISSYATGGSGGEDRLTENVTLHFQKMEGTYRQQQPDGSLGSPITWTVAGVGCR